MSEITEEIWNAYRRSGLEGAAPLIERAAIEKCAKDLEESVKLLNDMRAVYPGDPTGEMGEEAELLQSIADRLRTLGD